ncbi:MAG TPA: arylsulfatase [Acetobacteraceae bacterium]|nr:arylsulfatase [Acetobacteraceae bacterium]
MLLISAARAQAPQQSALPAPDPRFAGHVGRTFRESSPPEAPRAVQAPNGAPNIVIIMIDDAGFGQYATFGGLIPSPTLDELAADGIRYNRFHNAGICSPSRAALLTGRNPHEAATGIVEEMATGYDGYTGILPQSAATIAEILKDNGYATAMFGKNHNTPPADVSPAGPFNHWPNAFGFEYFYGFNAWGTNQWRPLLYENTRPVPPSTNPTYFLTDDLVDHAIAWVRGIKAAAPNKPYLLYLATGATHAPHQAPKEWIDKFEGAFNGGWDRYRETVFARQKQLGVIPPNADLTPRPAPIAAWDSLPAGKRKILAREMEVFAGFAAETDAQIGRMIHALNALPGGRNTLTFFIAGDNGASAEGGFDGTVDEIAPANGLAAEAAPTEADLPALGGPDFNNHFAVGWAWALNTPFRYYKQVVSHLGAIRDPLVVSWPGHIADKGGLRAQFIDIADIAPTIYDAVGITQPALVNGVAQKRMDGISFTDTFTKATAPELRQTQYFEVFGNRGIYDHGWFASAKLADPWQVNRDTLDPDKVKWELYDLTTDFTQDHDLAEKYPAKLEQMRELWWAEAARNNVLPLDWRAGGRLERQPPNPRTHFVYSPGLVNLPEILAPNIRNRSWTITATGRFSPDDHGVLITQGGSDGGWAIYMRNGRLTLDYNFDDISHYRVQAEAPIAAGTVSLTVRFDYDGAAGKERGKGGTVTLLADGKRIGAGRLPRTLPTIFAVNEGLDVGADYGSPAGDYPFPFPFTGALTQVEIDLR